MAGMTEDTQTNESDSSKSEPLPQKSGNGIALLALLAGIAALGASGWLYLQSQNPAGNSNKDELSSIQRKLDQTDGKAAYNAETIERLNGRLDELTNRLQIVPDQITRIEDTLANLPQSNAEATARFLELEADWYLRLADSQLSIAGNNLAAREALLLADERLGALANPRYIPVRNRIIAAAAELELQPEDSTAAKMAVVQEMLAGINEWPLKPVAPENFHGTNDNSDDGEGWDRAVNAVTGAFSSIIEVRETDERATPQVDNADIELLYRSLELDLQMARLALLRNDVQLINESLNAVALRLNIWFDTNAEPVAKALGDIELLRNNLSTVPLPDIAAIRGAYAQLQGNGQ